MAIPARGDPRFGDVADDVARRTTPHLLTDLPPDEEGKNAKLMLYSVIVECIKNRPLRLIMETESRDGREALRKLDAESRSTCRGNQMALLKRITHPHLISAVSDAEYIGGLSEWQKVAREYERISGKELNETVKTATLHEEAPTQLQEHLRLRSEEICTDYKKVVLSIEGYVRSKKSCNSGGPADMDIGTVNEGKCWLKGKDKGKGKGDKGTEQPRGKGKGKNPQPKHNEKSQERRRLSRSKVFPL